MGRQAQLRRRALLDACALTVSWRYPRRSRSARRGEEQIRYRVPRRHRAGHPRPRGRCRPSAPTCPTASLVLDQPMPPRCRLGAFFELTQLSGVTNSPCADFGESIRKLPRASAHPRQPVRGEPFARRGTQTEGLVLSVRRGTHRAKRRTAHRCSRSSDAGTCPGDNVFVPSSMLCFNGRTCPG